MLTQHNLPLFPPRYQTIGHRGAGKLAPENSLQGFKLAQKLGLTWVEFDTQPCKSGEWILMHDEDLARTTHTQGLVAQSTWSELAPVQIGQEFLGPQTFETIPLLSEALKTLAALDLYPNIEIKSALPLTEQHLEDFLTILQLHWPASKPAPLISSFNAEILFNIKARTSQYPLAYNIEHLQADTFEQLKQANCFSLHCDYEQLTEETLQYLLAQPIPLVLYTVNDPVLAEQYFRQGVWAIFSDFPNSIAQSFSQV